MEKRHTEMRKQTRLLKRMQVEFAVGAENYTGFSRNLSLDGLFVKTRKRLPEGEPVSMIIHLPDGSVSNLRGTIRRAVREPFGSILEQAGIPSKDGIGVQIIERDNHYTEFISS